MTEDTIRAELEDRLQFLKARRDTVNRERRDALDIETAVYCRAQLGEIGPQIDFLKKVLQS